MKIRPWFSIIIPTYNRRARLRICLQAILAQSFNDFEVIVVDDGGNDFTEDLIKEFHDSRIIYIWQVNSGPLRARAAGAERAQGEWLCFCDSDDQWHRDYLKTVREVQLRTNVNVLFTDYLVEGDPEPRVAQLEENGFFKGQVDMNIGALGYRLNDSFIERLLETQPVMISAFAIKYDFYKFIGGIDKDLNVIGSEDSDLTLRAFGRGKSFYVKAPNVTLGRGEDNLSTNYIRNLEGGVEIMEKIKEKQEVPKKFNSLLSKKIARQRLEIAEQYYWKRQLKESIIALKHVGLTFFLRQQIKLALKILMRLILLSRQEKV